MLPHKFFFIPDGTFWVISTEIYSRQAKSTYKSRTAHENYVLFVRFFSDVPEEMAISRLHGHFIPAELNVCSLLTIYQEK